MSSTPPTPTPAERLALMPFAVQAAIELETAAADEVVGRLPWTPERCTAGGLLHGGALLGLADTVAAVCAFLNLPPRATTATISLNATWFGAVREGDVQATSRPLHVGRTTIAVQSELVNVRDGGDAPPKRIAIVTSLQSVQSAG